jgi:hypothetical protein
MSLLQSFLNTLRSLRRRRGGPRSKDSTRSRVAVERLDHRQLLTVNFTGNVITDFPAAGQPGVAILSAHVDPIDPNADQVAEVPAYLQPYVQTSGFAVNQIFVSYDSEDDILSVGFNQPESGNGTGKSVIAGDADDNGNAGNPAWPSPLPPPVDPTVAAVVLSETGFVFQDFAELAGSEGMYSFLDFNADGTADVVAGFSNDPFRPNFEIADAVTSVPGAAPSFGAPLTGYTGSFFLSNDSQHPNLEFQIANFSDLYLAKTGQTLKSDSYLAIGAFAGSDADDGISSTFINFKPFTLPTVPVPECPIPPDIWVNPHEHRHINTAHPTDVRVYVLGASNFDVNDIVDSTVTFAGASPYITYDQPVNHDQYMDRVYVFNSLDLDLDGGLQDALLVGQLEDGRTFRVSRQVFVRDDSFYSPADLAVRDAKRENGNLHSLLTPFQQRLYHQGLLEVDGELSPAAQARQSVALSPSRAALRSKTILSQALTSQTTRLTQKKTAKTAATTPKVTVPIVIDDATQGASNTVKITTANGRSAQARSIKIDTRAYSSR